MKITNSLILCLLLPLASCGKKETLSAAEETKLLNSITAAAQSSEFYKSLARKHREDPTLVVDYSHAVGRLDSIIAKAEAAGVHEISIIQAEMEGRKLAEKDEHEDASKK